LETMIQVSGKQDVVTEQDPSFGTGLPRRTWYQKARKDGI
jgi:hypothetical protein